MMSFHQSRGIQGRVMDSRSSTAGLAAVLLNRRFARSSIVHRSLATNVETQALSQAPASVSTMKNDVHPVIKPDAPPPVSSPEPFTVLNSLSLCSGTLDLIHWEENRLIRVWTPPGFYKTTVGRTETWPVLYLQDGQNLFDDKLSFSGSSWKAAEAASGLIASGAVPPFVIVGLDHSGKTRSLDYTPYKPGSGPGGFRKDAADWPGGGVDEYLDRLETEIMPWAQREYEVASSPDLVAFGGSSFGGICTLMASMRKPGLFGAALIESPSLWLAEEKVLKEDVASFKGQWPERIFIGMGGREYSGNRKKEDENKSHDQLVASYGPALEKAILAQGVPALRVRTVVEPSGAHTESAWAKRLPSALAFLLAPWWGALLAARGTASGEYLYLTVPSRPRAGLPATLLVNKDKSSPLAGCRTMKIVAGFNQLWSDKVETSMVPLDKAAVEGKAKGSWQFVKFNPVPSNAYEINFALSDETGQTWDSNGGSNFYHRVDLPEGQRDGSVGGGSQANQHHSVEESAKKNSSQLYFTYPEKLVAGQGAMLYFNRRQSEPFRDSHNIKIQYGYNNWEMGTHHGNVTPTNLWRSEWADWWGMHIHVPEGAEDMHFCFHDGQGTWDSNFGANYCIAVKKGANDAEPTIRQRTVASEESLAHADGTLHVLTLSKRDSGDKVSDRNSKWTEEKVVRVWTPKGFSKESAPRGGWPVLFVNDAQNKFECWLAHQGVSWRVGYTASALIASGQVPPFVIVGIDNPGPMRSLNYLPYAPGSGVGGFRGDAARWPGGGVEQYMQRLVKEIMPMVQEKYSLASDPSRVAFGGGSFGGVNALYVAQNFSHVFGSVLAESPSLWIAEARFLEDMWGHKGMLPERLFMGCGTKEYSATRDHVRDDVDALLLHYYCEAARALEDKGVRQGNGRLRFLIEEGAGHHELAWQWRLTGALQYLLGPWKN